MWEKISWLMFLSKTKKSENGWNISRGGVVLAVEESKQRRDARFAVTAGTLPSQPNKAPLGWHKGFGETIASKGDLRGDFLKNILSLFRKASNIVF